MGFTMKIAASAPHFARAGGVSELIGIRVEIKSGTNMISIYLCKHRETQHQEQNLKDPLAHSQLS